MTKEDKMALMVVGAIALVLYLVHARNAQAAPVLSPPVPVRPNAGLLPASTNANNLVSVATPEETQLIPSESSAMYGVGGITEDF